MLPEIEREIRIQFLETSTEYLNKLENILSEINAEPQYISDKINTVLRILHSLKGSSGMLGLRILSDLAHRLEDAFQVLKNRKISSAIDADLHNLLLSSVDWLHHILELVESNYLIDEHWLITFCYPLFEELYQRLGKPELEESNSEFTHIPNPENIIHFLFKTEVEINLQSLEQLLENQDFLQLKESAFATAKELTGLGDILDIPVFTQLCQSIKQKLLVAKSPADITNTTSLALQLWRRSQSLILNQNVSELPSVINQFWDGDNIYLRNNYLE